MKEADHLPLRFSFVATTLSGKVLKEVVRSRVPRWHSPRFLGCCFEYLLGEIKSKTIVSRVRSRVATSDAKERDSGCNLIEADCAHATTTQIRDLLQCTLKSCGCLLVNIVCR